VDIERLDRLFTKLTEYSALFISGGFLFASVLYVSAHVFARYIRNPIPGTANYVAVFMIPICYFGLAYVWFKKGYVVVDILQSRLKGKTLWGFQFTFAMLTFVCFLALFWYGGVQESLRVIANHQRIAEQTTVHSPVWPWLIMLTTGAFMMVVRAALDLVRMIRTRQVIPDEREVD